MKRVSIELFHNEFVDKVVTKKIIFEDTVFEKRVAFNLVDMFEYKVIFLNCIFEAPVCFYRCNFKDGLRIQNCHFIPIEAALDLYALQCDGDFELLNCVINSQMKIIDSFFNGKTIFHKTEFKQSINLFDPNSESFGSVDFVGGLSIFR